MFLVKKSVIFRKGLIRCQKSDLIFTASTVGRIILHQISLIYLLDKLHIT